MGYKIDQDCSYHYFWFELEDSVRKGDFDRFKKLYHLDAVLVDGISKTSLRMLDVFHSWRQDFQDVADGRVKADIEFKIESKSHGDTCSLVEGMFYYSLTDESGLCSACYIYFEGLLIFQKGWKLMMEHQKSIGTIDDWNNI